MCSNELNENNYLVWACMDCMFAHANGELPDDIEPDREPLELLDGYRVSLGMLHENHTCGLSQHQLHDQECECETKEFSMNSCEGCGSSLGGSRFALTIWE